MQSLFAIIYGSRRHFRAFSAQREEAVSSTGKFFIKVKRGPG